MRSVILIILFLLTENFSKSYFLQNDCSDTLTTTLPVFRVDYSFPTSDKPQSKLWFSDNCWWAILPRAEGPSLWQRFPNGWLEHTRFYHELKGIPGRVDVWSEKKYVMVVGVEKSAISVFKLFKNRIPDTGNTTWKLNFSTKLVLPEGEFNIETVTIVRDGEQKWWVASAINSSVFVWNSDSAGVNWSHPIPVVSGIADDDICSLVALGDRVGLIWTDQKSDKLAMKVHIDGNSADFWEPEEIIDSGNKSADDHLNTAFTHDGTLWLVTKNSRDETGKPQLELRIRNKEGKWRKFSYATLQETHKPSRPIVIATANPSLVLAGHTVYDSKNNLIVFGQIDTTRSEILVNPSPVIVPDISKLPAQTRINDATGPKFSFPDDAPWIILASDREGNVYETNLKKLIFGDFFE